MPVRILCAFVRAIHGVLGACFPAIFRLPSADRRSSHHIPYAGIFAKVIRRSWKKPTGTRSLLPPGYGRCFGLPVHQNASCWVQLRAYTAPALECGLRSSAILGFVSLPTLGFYLESAFSQGHYSDADAMLILFYVLLATAALGKARSCCRLYRWRTVFLAKGLPVSGVTSAGFHPGRIDAVTTARRRRLGRHGRVAGGHVCQSGHAGHLEFLVILTQVALVATGIIALLAFPLISTHQAGLFAVPRGMSSW